MRYVRIGISAAILGALWLGAQGCKGAGPYRATPNQELGYLGSIMMRVPTVVAEKWLIAFEKGLGPDFERLDKSNRIIAVCTLGTKFFWEHEYGKSFLYLDRGRKYSGDWPDHQLIYVAALANRADWLAKEIEVCEKNDHLLRQVLTVSLAWAKSEYRGVIAAADVPIPNGILSGPLPRARRQLVTLISFMKTRALAQLGEHREAQEQFDSTDHEAIIATLNSRESGMFVHMVLVYAEIVDELGELERIEPILPYVEQYIDMTPRRGGAPTCYQRDWDMLQDMKRRMHGPQPTATQPAGATTKAMKAIRKTPTGMP